MTQGWLWGIQIAIKKAKSWCVYYRPKNSTTVVDFTFFHSFNPSSLHWFSNKFFLNGTMLSKKWHLQYTDIKHFQMLFAEHLQTWDWHSNVEQLKPDLHSRWFKKIARQTLRGWGEMEKPYVHLLVVCICSFCCFFARNIIYFPTYLPDLLFLIWHFF